MKNNKKMNLIFDKITNKISLLEGEPSDNMISVCHENMRSGLYDVYTYTYRGCLSSLPGMTYCHDTLTLMGIMNIEMDPELSKSSQNSKHDAYGCLEFMNIINKSLHMNSINFKELLREQKERDWYYRIFPFNVYFIESDSINVTIPYRGIEYNIYMLEEQVDKEAYDLSGYGLRETTNRRLEYIKNSTLYKGLESYVEYNINELSINADSDIDDKFILNLLFNMGFDEDNMYDLGLQYNFDLHDYNMLSVKDNILSPDNTWEKSKYYYAAEDKEECIMHVMATYIIHLLCHKLYDNNITAEEYYSKYYFNSSGSLIRKGKVPGAAETLVFWYEKMHSQVLRMISLIERCATTMINIKIDWTNRLDLQDYIEKINDPDIIYLESEDNGYRVSGGCPLIFFRKHLGIVNKNINPERYVTPEKVHHMVCDVLTILYATPDNFTMEHLYSIYDVYELNLILRCILYKYMKK